MNIEYKLFDKRLLKEYFDEFILLKNYNSSLHFKNGDIDSFNKKKSNELFEYMDKNAAYVVGAFDDKKLIGFIWAYPRIFFIEKRLFINTLVVSKEYSGRGIGKSLISYLTSFAKKNLDITSLDVNVYPKNANAIGFYKHLGFEDERIQMKKEI